MRNVKQVHKLGVHGLSLGGGTATHLARACDLDFLFADRTFSTIGDITRYNFGQVAFYPFQIFGPVDTDSAGDYISVGCYKVLSADPRDDMIDDLASLKSGAAIQLFIKQSGIPYIDPGLFDKKSHLLSLDDFNNFLESLVRIGKLTTSMVKIMHEAISPDQIPSLVIKSLSAQKVYKITASENQIDYEKAAEIIVDIQEILANLDAGGKSLVTIYTCKHSRLCLLVWLLVLDIWGSSPNEYVEDLERGKSIAIETVRCAIGSIRDIITENKGYVSKLNQAILKDLQVLHDAFSTICRKLEGEDSSDAEDSLCSFDIIRESVDYSSAGYLIPLKNGHNGLYSSIEKHVYEKHLFRARFLS